MKVTLNSITSGFAGITALNDNFDAIATAIENTVSRDGTTPNTMEADLDMNGHRILNALAQSGDGFIWTGGWVTATSYAVNNLTYSSGNAYICLEAHTSGVFATDLAAAKWELFASKGAAGAGTGDMIGSNNLSDLTNVTTARTNLGVAIGTQVQAYSAGIPTTLADQTDAEAGSNNTKWMSPLRVAQAIAALVASTTVPTGVSYPYFGTTAPTGYVMASGRTIGSAASGGTERANADTEDLYVLLWNSMTNTEAPVSGGRGASAAADFAANKTLQLPDCRDRSFLGKGDMGGSSAARVTSAVTGLNTATLGAGGGVQAHTLTAAESGLPSHAHTVATSAGGGGATPCISANIDVNIAPTAFASSSVGGSGASSAHINLHPVLVTNVIIKL